MLTTPQRAALRVADELIELPSSVRRGWVPEPVRRLPAPAGLVDVLGGGVPRGRVSEVIGPLSSGRTSVVHALLAAATAAHEVVAVVDVPNAFDPRSAQRAAVNLSAVLWVRPPSLADGLRCAELILGAGGFGAVVLDLDQVPLRRLRLHVWPRLARAAEHAGTALIILAPQRVAGSFATLTLALARRMAHWRRERWSSGCVADAPAQYGENIVGRGHRPPPSTTGEMFRRRGTVPPLYTAPVLFDGFETQVLVERSKLGPPGATQLVHCGFARWAMPTLQPSNP